MSSLRSTISSRTNGARSRGAITPAGRTRSSGNATRHETRLHRIFQRALANLILMRSLQEPNPTENIELPNDPSPISGQLAVPETEPGETRPEPAVEPAPPPEDIKLPIEPSPISRQLVQSVMRTHGYLLCRTIYRFPAVFVNISVDDPTGSSFGGADRLGTRSG